METTHGKNQIVGFFKSRKDAEAAVVELKELGIRSDNIQIETTTRQEETRTGTHDSSSTGILDSSVGTFFNKLFGLGTPNHQYTTPEYSAHFTRRLESGDVLVAVKTYEYWDRAIAIFNRYNALEDYDHNDVLTQKGQHLQATDDKREYADEKILQLRKEILETEKQRVQTGEVSVRKEVKTHTEHVKVPVSKEEVIIERKPVTTGSVHHSSEPISNASSEEIRIPLSEEKVEVNKVTIPKEEVIVKKETTHSQKEISEELREEEAKIEGNVRERHSSHTTPDHSTDASV